MYEVLLALLSDTPVTSPLYARLEEELAACRPCCSE